MKIAIIGASGFVGSSILNELANRNHEITAIARNPKETANAKWVAADIFNIDALGETLKGNDVVISAYNPGWSNPNIYNDAIAGAKAIQEAVKKSGVKRFITIGGAGSLYIAPNLQLIDTPEFPKEIFSADGRIIWRRSAGMITFAVGIAGRLYRCSRKAEFRPIRETGGEESPGNAERRAS